MRQVSGARPELSFPCVIERLKYCSTQKIRIGKGPIMIASEVWLLVFRSSHRGLHTTVQYTCTVEFVTMS